MQSPRAVECGLFLGRLDQGLVGNAESTHVNRPKGNACSIGWKMLQILKVNQCRVDHLRQVVKFIHTKIPWNLENLNSTRNPQVR